MRALFVSSAYAAPESRAKLRALAGLGITVAAVVPEQAGAPAAGDDLGVRILPVPVSGPTGPRRAWDRRALRRAFSDFNPDLVQLEEEPWSRVATRVAALARRHPATLVQYTADTLSAPLGMVDRARRRRVLERVSGIAAANRIAADHVAALRPGIPVAVVPQLGIVPPASATGADAGTELALGFVGRLLPSKGLDLLLRALVHVHGEWTLTVIGTGPAQESLEALSASLGLASRVRWLGALPRPDVARVWPEIGCLVLPARTVPGLVDSTGRVALEAMAQGIPAVVTASGALPEVVGEGGVVVPENDEAALRTAIQRLHDEPVERAALAAAARRRVLSHYAPDAVARRTLDLWEAARAVPAAASPR